MNKKRFVFGVIVLVLSIGVFCQPKCSNSGISGVVLYADSVKMKEQTGYLISRLKREITSEIQDSTSLELAYYNLAVCYAAKDLADSSCYFLYRALDYSSYLNCLIYTDTDFTKFYREPCWSRVIQKLDSSFLSKQPGILNRKLAVELYRIYLQDQQTRGFGQKKMIGSNINIDSINLKRVEEIIRLYGWPTYSLVGETAAKGAFLTIQHSDIHIQQKYFMLLFEAAKKNEASKEWVALLLDRITVQKNGFQYFGTQVYVVRDSVGETIRYKYFPIQDEERVDSLRKAFDMIPLKEYYSNFGIDYKPPKQ